jgi:S-formylglutathione hydrolase FrmB
MIPVNAASVAKLPAVYLLHGGGADFRSWSNDSDVAQYAARGLVLVMPEGESSYYVNSATNSRDRYEDYLVRELIPDVEHRFPVVSDRSSRAVVGVSMGGYGAVYLALTHPELFAFAAAISPALDVPSRSFSIHRIGQWRHFRSIFGPIGSATERAGDPYVLEKSADPAYVPYLYLACGEQEALLGPDRRFAVGLAKRHFLFEFHTAPGGHDWKQWNAQLPGLFRALLRHIEAPPESSPPR